MKCPCCGAQREADFLVAGRVVHFPDGTSVKLANIESNALQHLLQHPLRIPRPGETAGSIFVAISRLRRVLEDLGLPYRIKTDRVNHQWMLKKVTPDVENHDAS